MTVDAFSRAVLDALGNTGSCPPAAAAEDLLLPASGSSVLLQLYSLASSLIVDDALLVAFEKGPEAVRARAIERALGMLKYEITSGRSDPRIEGALIEAVAAGLARRFGELSMQGGTA